MKSLRDVLKLGKKAIKPIAKPLVLSFGMLFGGKAIAQTPIWYDAFSPKNEVVNYFGSYGSGDVDQDGDVDMDDVNAMETIKNFYSDVDADGNQSTAQDKQIATDYVNGIIKYLPAEFWRSTPSEKEGWVRNIYPIMTRLNDREFIPASDTRSQDINTKFDSGNGSVQDFLSGNGYNPNRDDFYLIHSKYNLDYNGLFNLPISAAGMHKDDGTLNHGISAIFTGTNLNDLENWLFLEPQTGKVIEPGVDWSLPFNSEVIIYGVKNFKDSNIVDKPRYSNAVKIHFDSQGNREMTYINPNMILDQTSLGVEDENTNTSNPKNYSLEQNYPNPFNPKTTIKYNIPNEENVNLTIYDINGREVETLLDNKKMPAGEHEINWDPKDNLTSGIYLGRLQAGKYVKTQKLTYTK